MFQPDRKADKVYLLSEAETRFMKTKNFNWQIVAGFLLTIFAFISYPFIFSQWPVTRDFPWLNLVLFAVAAVLVFLGLRRAFSPASGKFSKIAASVLALLSGAAIALFVFMIFIVAAQLPKSAAAPQVGQKVPDFTLTDTSGKQVTLAEILPNQKGVLLIFYRGYW